MKALTEQQLADLKELEPQLVKCVRVANFDRAEDVAKRIKLVFGKDNSHHRFLRALNIYSECAIEAHRYSVAASTLGVVRERARSSTRIYVEAKAIQTIAYFRLKKYQEAKEGARIVIRYLNKIKSDPKRRQFQKRFIERIQDECILAGLSGVSNEHLNPDHIQEKAIYLIQHNDEQEILTLIENQMPGEAILLIKDVTSYAILQLPPADRKFLLPPDQKDEMPKLGTKCVSALKRVAWKTFCHPESEIFKLWSKKVPAVYGSGYFAAALTAAFTQWNIGFSLIAAGMVAIAMKYGCEEFCTTFIPDSLMIPPSEKEKPTKWR